MMFEGAVMATIQELGGDYGLQRSLGMMMVMETFGGKYVFPPPKIGLILQFPRFVGNFGAIVFAPVGGWLIDSWNLPGTDFR